MTGLGPVGIIPANLLEGLGPEIPIGIRVASVSQKKPLRPRRDFVRALLAATTALFLAAITGAFVLGIATEGSGVSRAGMASLALVLQGGAAYAICRATREVSGGPRVAAFRVAPAVALALTLAVFFSNHRVPTVEAFLVFGILTAGSFFGGLAASSRDFGFWEDNFPPPASLQTEVREAHAAWALPLTRLPAGKGLVDRLGSALGLLVLSPVGLLISFLIWMEDPGPLLFAKNCVGRGGSNFRLWKFRTMRRGAESESGPVWAEKEDQRVLRVGRILRRTALDELPQLVNILLGQMSFVGPRPQRTVLVAQYLRTIPEYAARHRLPPGLAGLAQVAGHYYLTPRQKLRFDRLYLAHASLGLDLRLVLIAAAVVFWLRWRPDWDGRLPRSWLHRRPARRKAKTF